jgi:hypothetical protein
MRKEYDFSQAKRGPAVRLPKGKTRITMRLDDDVFAWFKRQANKAVAALREYIQRSDEPLEETLCRVCVKSCVVPAPNYRLQRTVKRHQAIRNRSMWHHAAAEAGRYRAARHALAPRPVCIYTP